jgi:hypothetical protein
MLSNNLLVWYNHATTEVTNKLLTILGDYD